MTCRLEFVLLASQPGTNLRQLCRRFGISTKTGYKWRQRYATDCGAGLVDRSRKPHLSPTRITGPITGEVIALYRQWGWGGRKLRRRLLDLGHPAVPAASTCTEIVRRAGLYEREQPAATPCQRFSRASPNELWQMDFKGDFATQRGSRCYPITVLDDHSRFNVLLAPAGNQTGQTVRAFLQAAFATYGLPEAILCDNGPPWGAPEPVCPHTTFTIWLLQLGVRVRHGRPRHPQTQGKDERFHRTLHRELLSRHTWRDLAHCRELFPGYRERYNCERPHDALGGDTPVRHYRPSPRALPGTLSAPEYAAGTTVQLVRSCGMITFGGQTWYIGRAFAGLPVGLRPSPQSDGQWEVWFAHEIIGRIDLHTPAKPKHTLRSIYAT